MSRRENQLLHLLLMIGLPALLLAGCGDTPDNEGGSAGGGPEQSQGNPQGSGETRETTDRVAESPEEVGANEAGRVMVLEYHRVGGDPGLAPNWTISTEQFRRELEYLYENGYHPVNFRDLVRGEMEVPAGKTPVVLTFDDSSDTQFTMVRDNGQWVPEPGGAVGVLAAFHRDHPDWPMKGTFFVLPEARAPNNLFGQPELGEEKLRYLADHGFEIGSHTLYHANLALSSPAQVREQLARSVAAIREYLPGYDVESLSLPFGEYPQNEVLLESGTWKGMEYDLEGAAEVSGGASPPPYSVRFDPYHVSRIQTGQSAYKSQGMFRYFEQNPDERYVSDGNPDTVAFPGGEGDDLARGAIREAGKRIRAY